MENRAYAAAVAVCSAAVLLLLAITAMELSTVVKATDRAGVEQTSNLMPVHHEGAREDIKPGVHRRATVGDEVTLALLRRNERRLDPTGERQRCWTTTTKTTPTLALTLTYRF